MILISRLPMQTIKSQAQLIVALNGRLDEQDKAMAEMKGLISNLQGQVEVYRGMPLEQMRDSMNAIADTNKKILDTLAGSIVTLAKTEASKVTATDRVAARL